MQSRDASSRDFEVALEVFVGFAVPPRTILDVGVDIFDHARSVIDESAAELAPASAFAELVDQPDLLGEEISFMVGDVWMEGR